MMRNIYSEVSGAAGGPMLSTTVTVLGILTAADVPVNRAYNVLMGLLISANMVFKLTSEELKYADFLLSTTTAVVAWALIDKLLVVIPNVSFFKTPTSKVELEEMPLPPSEPSTTPVVSPPTQPEPAVSIDPESLTYPITIHGKCWEGSDESDDSYICEGFSSGYGSSEGEDEHPISYRDVDDYIDGTSSTEIEVLDLYAPEPSYQRDSLKRYIKESCVQDFDGKLLRVQVVSPTRAAKLISKA